MKNIPQTSLIVQSQSKKCGIYRYGNMVQYYWNVILFSLLLYTIVIQTMQKVLKLAYQLSCFFFFGKLKMTFMWIQYSMLCIWLLWQKKNFDKKQGGRLLSFWFFSRPTGNLLGASLVCCYFESVEHGAILLLFEHSLLLTEAQNNLFCSNLSFLFFSSEWSL